MCKSGQRSEYSETVLAHGRAAVGRGTTMGVPPGWDKVEVWVADGFGQRVAYFERSGT